MTRNDTDSPTPLFDPSDALERAGGRPEVAGELLGILQATLPDTADRLRRAHETGDLERLRDAVHRLRGATLYCGVPRMRQEAVELEQLCIDGAIAQTGPALHRLLETIESTRALEAPPAGQAEHP